MITSGPTTQIYDALLHAYNHFNAELFDGSLPPVLIVLQRQAKMMGYVSHKRWKSGAGAFTDELAVNPEYFLGYPQIEILQTLCHEMTHLHIAKFGNPGRRGYHNKEWANKMISIGLMPSDTGKPGGKITGEAMGDYPLAHGKFLLAATKLIKDGFALPWLDRLPKPLKYYAHAVYDERGVAVKLESEEHLQLVQPLGGVPIRTTTPGAEIGIAIGAQMNAPFLSGEETIGESLSFTPIEYEDKKPTRNKYRCPCGTNVWGKPGLKIQCMECKTEFAENQ